MTDVRRPYRSKLRDEQAWATRRLIIDAGAELFVARGYASTTIDAIAAAAGVGRKTVFTSVGGKAALLKLAFDRALAGDDEPVAIADRTEMQRMMHDDDPAALLAAWIAMNAAIAGRVAALHHVLVVAADADPEAAALLATLEGQRAQGASAIVTRMADLGGLRPGLDPQQAAAIADLLIDPMPYRRLVEQHGWTPEAYTRYLQRAAAERYCHRRRPADTNPKAAAGRSARAHAPSRLGAGDLQPARRCCACPCTHSPTHHAPRKQPQSPTAPASTERQSSDGRPSAGGIR